MHRQFLPLSLERIFRTGAFRLNVFSRRRHSHRAALESFMTYIPASLLCYSSARSWRRPSARSSHGMMSREESGRLGDHVWLTGQPEIAFSGGLRGCCPEVHFWEVGCSG